MTDLFSTTLHLANIYPDFDEFDIKDIIEEKMNSRIDPEEFQTIRAAYVKVAIQRSDFES